MTAQFELNELALYLGKDYKLSDKMVIHQPTIGQIIEMGEEAYFGVVQTLTAVPSDMIAQLDKMGIDWETITPFELFSMMALSLPVEKTRVFFGDLDFTQFEIIPKEGEHQHVLHHKILDFDLDEMMYIAMTNYICTIHKIKKLNKTAGNARTKKLMIEMAYEDLEMAKKKKKPKSQLMSLISTMVNMPGFKYKLRELEEVGYLEFLDSVSRTHIIISSVALLVGTYMGNVDMKKLDKKKLDYTRDIGSNS